MQQSVIEAAEEKHPMTNAKLTTALSTLAQRAPGLLTSIETFSALAKYDGQSSQPVRLN